MIIIISDKNKKKARNLKWANENVAYPNRSVASWVS